MASYLDDVLRRAVTSTARNSGLTTSNLGRSPRQGNDYVPNDDFWQQMQILRSNPDPVIKDPDQGFLGKLADIGAKAGMLGLKSLGPLDYGRRAVLASMVELDKRGNPDYWDFGDSKLANAGEWAAGIGFDIPTKVLPYDILPAVAEQIREMRGIEAKVPEGREATDQIGWMDRFRNPDFGYGQILYDKSGGGFETALEGTGGFGEFTGRSLDKLGGFAGDVAFDPTTYVTGGATAVAGKAQRFAMASKLATKVGKVPGVTEEMVTRMATKGPAFFDDAERALINEPYLFQRGLRLGNPAGGAGSVRIPLTGKVDEFFSKLVARPRNAVTSSGMYGGLVEARRAPDGFEEIYRVLRSGKTQNGLTPTMAALALSAKDTLGAAKGLYVAQWSRGMQEVFKGLDEAERITLTHATQQGESSLSPILRQIRSSLVDEGLDIGDITKVAGVEGYMPMMLTREAIDAMSDTAPNQQLAQALRKKLNVKVDLTKREGMTMSRNIRPGSKLKFTVGDEVVEILFENGTILEANEKLTAAFPELNVAKWFEDDAGILMTRYVDQAASSAGQARMLFELLRGSPDEIATNLENVSTEIIDEVATATKNRQAKDMLDGVIKRRNEEIVERSKQLINDANESRGVFIEALQENLKNLGRIGGIVSKQLDNAKATKTSLKETKQTITRELAAKRKELTALRVETEKQFFVYADEADRLKFAIASGVDPQGVPWAEVTRKELAKVNGNKRAVLAKIEKLRDETKLKVEQLDATFVAMEQVLDEVAFADTIISAVEAELNNPARLREIVESENFLLFEEEVRKVGEVRGPKVLGTRQMAENLRLAREDLADREAEFLNWAQRPKAKGDDPVGVLVRAADEESAAASRVEKAKYAAIQAKADARTAQDEWLGTLSKFKNLVESDSGKVALGRFEELLALIGSSNWSVDRTTGKLVLSWGPEAREFAQEITAVYLDYEKLRDVLDDAGQYLVRQDRDVAATFAALQERGAEEWRGAWDTAVSYLDDVFQQAKAKYLAAEILFDEARKDVAAGPATRDSLIARFSEVFNTGGQDPINFEEWFPLQLFSKSLKGRPAFLVPLAEQMFDDAIRSIEGVVDNSLLQQIKPQWEKYVNSLAAEKQAKLHFKDVSRFHSVAKSENQKLNRLFDSGQLKRTYLNGAQERVRVLEKEAIASRQTHSKVLDSIYETSVRPIVEGSEAGKLPYEREVLERQDLIETAKSPLSVDAEQSKFIVSGTRPNGTKVKKYQLSTGPVEVLSLRPNSLTPEQMRGKELSQMSPAELAIYGGGDELDPRFADQSKQTVEDLIGDVADEADEPKRVFGEATPEQREADLAKRRATNKRKNEINQTLSEGKITPLEVWRLATEDDNYKNIKLKDVLANLPGSSKARAVRVMDELGITSNRRIRALKADDPRLGPDKLREAVVLVGTMKRTARPAPDMVRNMVELADEIAVDAVIPVEIRDRITEIAQTFSDQRKLSKGLAADTVREEKLAAHYRRRLGNLQNLIDSLEDEASVKGLNSSASKKLERAKNDVYDLKSALAILDEQALTRSQTVNFKLKSFVEMEDLKGEFNDLIDWSNMYVRGLQVGLPDGDQLATRVTAELRRKQKNAADQRLKTGSSGKISKRTAKGRRSTTQDQVIVEEAVEALIPQLDNLYMVEAQRNQLRRISKQLEQESLRPIDGLEDLSESTLRQDLIDARLREESDFVEDAFTVQGLGSGTFQETEFGYSITYGEVPQELNEQIKTLGAYAQTVRRDLYNTLGTLFAVGRNVGGDLQQTGDARKALFKRLKNAFNSGGRNGLAEVVFDILDQVPESSKMDLLRKAQKPRKNDRAIFDRLSSEVSSLGVGVGNIETLATVRQAADSASNYVKQLKAEIKAAKGRNASPEVIRLKQERLAVAEQVEQRSASRLAQFESRIPSKKKPKASVTLDWRDSMGVAPEGYVSPLSMGSDDWDRVANAYRSLREKKEGILAAAMARRDEYVYGEGATALQRAATDAGVRPTVARRLELDAERLIREIDRGKSGEQALVDSLKVAPTLKEALGNVRSQRDEVLERAGLLDQISQKISVKYEELSEQLALVDFDEAAQISAVETLIGETDKDIALLAERLKEISGTKKSGSGMAGVQLRLDKLSPDEFTFDNVKDLTAELKGIVDSVDPNDMYGMVAVAIYEKHLDDVASLGIVQNDALPNLKAWRDKAKANELIEIFKFKANKGFMEMGEVLGADRMIAVAEPLAKAISNIEKSMNSGAFIESIELANRFFKTYATLSPGFHVRNWMGATFMNLTEGVEVKNTREAYEMASDFRKMGNDYIRWLRSMAADGDGRSIRQLKAFEAAFGSGASGRLSFGEIGKSNAQSDLVRKAMNTKTADKLLANKAVKLSQSVGTNFVELPARLALALDSLDRGMDMLGALNRIKRVHFDYSDLSKFDKKMKALIPFWVFMSRNMPLQIQQILQKPKMYQAYNSLIRNFKAEDQDMLAWQEGRNGWVLFNHSTMFGDPANIAILPDLQHVSMVDDIGKADPTDPFKFLSQANPMFRVPAEFALDRKFYKDRPFYDNESKAEYALLQSVPPAAQAARLLGLGPYEDRSKLQSALNYLGVPLYQVPPEQLRRQQQRGN